MPSFARFDGKIAHNHIIANEMRIGKPSYLVALKVFLCSIVEQADDVAFLANSDQPCAHRNYVLNAWENLFVKR